MTAPARRCAVCARNPATHGVICAGDRKRILEQLADLPAKIARLPLQLTPSTTPASEWVTVTANGSRPPVRLDALSLVGPGGNPVVDASALRPAVRQWSTTRTVTVQVTRAGGTVESEQRTIEEWHREPVLGPNGRPILILQDDDQVGSPPPKEWLDAQCRAWRAALGHHRPDLVPRRRSDRTHPMATAAAAAQRAAFMPWLARVAVWQPTAAAAYGLFQAIRGVRADQAATLLGMRPGRGGNRPADERVDDVVEELWHVRYGAAPDQAIRWDIGYLTNVLDFALEHDLGIAKFATQLASIHAELTHVLGDRAQTEWLGRCPASITDRTTKQTHLCGAGLRQEPYAAQVQCPRCRSTWGPGYNHLVLLAREIRRKHPVDRRRRYHAEDIGHIPSPLPCPACAAPVKIEWRDVTAHRDTRRYWVPSQVVCPAGCPEADRLR